MSGASARERIRDRSEAEPQYERRRPEQTPLCRLVRAHYESFAADVDATGTNLLQFVIDEFEAYLECGILAYGFLRLRCAGCARDTLVAFSCKRRGIYPRVAPEEWPRPETYCRSRPGTTA